MPHPANDPIDGSSNIDVFSMNGIVMGDGIRETLAVASGAFVMARKSLGSTSLSTPFAAKSTRSICFTTVICSVLRGRVW